jgi:signal transduction histidine kinase
VAVKTFLDLAPAKMAEEKSASQGLRNPDFWKEYHQNVQSQIEKINGLLKDLWTASETPSLHFNDKVFVHEAIGAALQSVQGQFAARRIQIDNRVPDSLPALNADKSKFYRLFELLLKDELASLPAGSCVTLSAELTKDGAKPGVVIQVRDNGPGLPQEALRVVFDPFVVRSDTPSEYGIHLMACFFIVYHHGGKIEAQSQPGRGTTFTIHLPLHPERAAPPPSEQEFLQKALLNEELWDKLIASE